MATKSAVAGAGIANNFKTNPIIADTELRAAVLGGIIYLTSTSLPYLEMSPTADPTWGAINACLLREVPQRVGFTVDATHTEAAGWNGEHLAACRIEGTVFTPAVSAVLMYVSFAE